MQNKKGENKLIKFYVFAFVLLVFSPFGLRAVVKWALRQIEKCGEALTGVKNERAVIEQEAWKIDEEINAALHSSLRSSFVFDGYEKRLKDLEKRWKRQERILLGLTIMIGALDCILYLFFRVKTPKE